MSLSITVYFMISKVTVRGKRTGNYLLRCVTQESTTESVPMCLYVLFFLYFAFCFVLRILNISNFISNLDDTNPLLFSRVSVPPAIHCKSVSTKYTVQQFHTFFRLKTMHCLWSLFIC